MSNITFIRSVIIWTPLPPQNSIKNPTNWVACIGCFDFNLDGNTEFRLTEKTTTKEHLYRMGGKQNQFTCVIRLASLDSLAFIASFLFFCFPFYKCFPFLFSCRWWWIDERTSRFVTKLLPYVVAVRMGTLTTEPTIPV